MSHGAVGTYPRLPVVAVGMLVLALAVGLRVVFLGSTTAYGQERGDPQFEQSAPRGSIWDRRGGLLATDDFRYTVNLAAREVRDPDTLAATLGPRLGISAADILGQLQDPNKPWIVLKGDGEAVDFATAKALDELEQRGLVTTPVRRRFYPLGADAAFVTGFYHLETQKALYGVEGYYDSTLAGQPGMLSGPSGTDIRGYRPPVGGTDLVLTIDRELQLAATRILADVIQSQEASGGTIIVLDPATGAILASASLPSFDPNLYWKAGAASLLDPAVSAAYEPGSVMKAMVMAAALDRGVANEASTYVDTGVVEVDGPPIYNFDRQAYGTIDMVTFLQHSLNVGAVHVSQLLGPEPFYHAMADFGYGAATGVDLFGEISGIVHVPGDPAWSPVTLAQNSFGQGIGVTPLQVVSAMGAIANHGRLMQPHIVGGTLGANGQLEPTRPRVVRQVIREDSARRMRLMLEKVVNGHVYQAEVPGHRVGGKTGTSQIADATGYDPKDTITSFCGFLPVDEPKAVILIKVDRPKVPRGSEVAAPVFAKMAGEVVRVLGLPPDADTAPDDN